jgi:hypothetical protein
VVHVPSGDTIVLTTAGVAKEAKGGGGGTSAAAATPEKAAKAIPEMRNSRTSFI